MSIYAYGDTVIKLLGYYATSLEGPRQITDHDAMRLLLPSELASLRWAPTDIPLVIQLQEKSGKSVAAASVPQAL